MDGKFWDERYGGETFAYGERPNAFLASLADRFAAGGRALVPGDGEGRNGVFLATRGMQVETLDLSALGVVKAHRLAAARGVTLDARQGDVLTRDWPVAAYDVIALLYLHLAAEGRRTLHARALAALKPGGLIVLEAFTPRQIEKQREGVRGGPREAALLYEPEDLRTDFAGAGIELLRETEAALEEGTLHVGRSAVVRMVARNTAGGR